MIHKYGELKIFENLKNRKYQKFLRAKTSKRKSLHSKIQDISLKLYIIIYAWKIIIIYNYSRHFFFH